MTCKGYDPKSVNVPKSVKTLAATYIDNTQRKAFIRSYVRILEDEARQRTTRNKDKK